MTATPIRSGFGFEEFAPIAERLNEESLPWGAQAGMINDEPGIHSGGGEDLPNSPLGCEADAVTEPANRRAPRPLLVFVGWFLLILAGDRFIEHNCVALLRGQRPLHNNDFRHMYAASCVLHSGGNFYDDQTLMTEAARRGITRLNPYVYPPVVAVLMFPLGSLSFSQAGFAWYFLNIGFALGSFLLLARLLEPAGQPWNFLIPALLMATSEPLTRTLTAGQLNVLLLFLLTLSAYGLDREKPIVGGIALGIAAAVKVFPALLILMLFWRRQGKAAGAALVTAVGLTLVAALAAGFAVTADYVELVGQMRYGSSTWSQFGQHFHIDPANQSPAALITRLLTVDARAGLKGVASLPGLAKALCYLVALALLAATSLVTRRRGSTPQSEREIRRLAFGLTLLTALLLPSLMWDHYLTIALLSAVLLLSDLTRRGVRPEVLMLAAVAVFLMNFPYNFWNPLFSRGWAIALASVKLPGVLILFGLLVVGLRAKHRPGAGTSSPAEEQTA